MRLLRMPGKMEVLIPSVSCLRGTHETAPLDQQGEPLRSAGSSRKNRGIATPVLRHWFAMTRRILVRTHCPPGLPATHCRKRPAADTELVPTGVTTTDQLTHALSAATRRTLIIYLRFLPISLLLFWAKWGILY